MISKPRATVLVLAALATLQMHTINKPLCEILWRNLVDQRQADKGQVDNDQVDNGQRTGPAYPIWSAGMRQQHKNVSELDALMRWRIPGKTENVQARRSVTEVLTYALAGVLPWYGTILPAIRFERPFSNTTRVQIALVEGLVDVTVDLHQCKVGRVEDNATTTTDGSFDVCFDPNDGSRDAMKRWCFGNGGKRTASNRLHNFPEPGHERWSCSDHAVVTQLVAAQVLDYLVPHGDRFYKDMTNNLFLDSSQPQASFVSIDHHGDPANAFRRRDYERDVAMKVLLDYPLPAPLRDNIRTVALLGSKDEFVQKFNATIGGELDNVSRVLEQLYRDSELTRRNRYDGNLTDLLWYRLHSVARFFNITMEE